MYFEYYLDEWPFEVRGTFSDMASAADVELADIMERAYVCPARRTNHELAFLITNGNSIDWMLTIEVRTRSGMLPPQERLHTGIRAAVKLGYAWSKAKSGGLTDVLRGVLGDDVQQLAPDAWAVGNLLYFGDSRLPLLDAPTVSDEGAPLPAAVPAFRAHFSAATYEDVDSELAPFGSDEGYELLLEWAERRDELGPNVTLEGLLADGGLLIDGNDGLDVDAATIIVSAAFTLLRLVGRIDEGGKQLALDALDTLIQIYDAPPELMTQRLDLGSWNVS